VPTLGELGLKGFEAGSWYGVLAPAGTARDIVTRLHTEIAAALKRPDVQKRFFDLGTDTSATAPSNSRRKYAMAAKNGRKLRAMPASIPNSIDSPNGSATM
jgi:tripartite-type tricarboxylate transporter receptor subunit TctC